MAEYLIAFNDEWVAPHTPEELHAKAVAIEAVLEEMRSAGVWIYGGGGLDATTALFNVQARDGEAVFTDGPFAETKEHLGGFSVLDLPDDEASRYWAGRMALALDWPQEVHRFPDRPDLTSASGKRSGADVEES